MLGDVLAHGVGQLFVGDVVVLGFTEKYEVDGAVVLENDGKQ